LKILGILVKRELSEVLPIVCSFLGVAALLATFGLFSVPKPLPAHAINLQLLLPAVVTMPAILQYTQMLIWNEKAKGTFLFLRMLPVTNDELMSSKLAALVICTSLTFVVPVVTVGVYLYTQGVSLTFAQMFNVLLGWLCLLLLAMGCAAASLAFNQQRALLLPYIALILILGVFGSMDKWVPPRYWKWILDFNLNRWAILLPSFGIWTSWRGILSLYRRRDFVKLVE
jgi:hypothetical protein